MKIKVGGVGENIKFEKKLICEPIN